MPKFTELDGGRSENESANANKRNISEKKRGSILPKAQKGLPEGRPKITETAAEL